MRWNLFRYNRTAAVQLWLAACLCLLLPGCLLKKTSATKATRFDHKLHAETVDAEMFADCSMCHNRSSTGAMSMPNHDTCADCHAIDMDAPDKECLTCHSLPEAATDQNLDSAALTQYLQQRYAARTLAQSTVPDDQRWDHQRVEHLDCRTCHGDVIANKPQDPANYHLENRAPEDCSICHAADRREVAPRDHASESGWLRMHGAMSLRQGLAPDCATCHTSASCDQCHRNEKPQSHTAAFRARGHGFMAAGNRQQCATCHQQDFCTSCHLQEKPANHTAAFRRTGHCRSCHEQSTSRGTSCQVCHNLELGNHSTVGRPGPGLQLHDLPQGFGGDMPNDCTQCHDFSRF